jgi:hypothetical protein
LYCNLRLVFPSAISPGIPKTAQLLGSCSVSDGVCWGTGKEKPAVIIRDAPGISNTSEPDRIAIPGNVANFDPTSISREFVFGGRKL